MAGEGSMLHAIKSLKQNRALLKKRRAKKQEISYGSDVTMVEFKEVSPEELERVKKKIRTEASQSKRHDILIFIVALIVVALAGYYWFFL